MTLLGFASGLPLALVGQALQPWMATEGLDIAAIGFLSLVDRPDIFKLLWALPCPGEALFRSRCCWSSSG